MKKTLLSILFVCFAFLFNIQNSNGQTATITIDLTSAGGSANLQSNNYGSGAQRTWTINSVDFGGKAITAATGGNAGNIQAQGSNGIFYNTTALPGRIVSITISYFGTARNYNCFGGSTSRLVNSTSANYSVSGGTQVGSSSSTGWTSTNFNSTNYTFFAIKLAVSNASYISSIEIEYELNEGPTDPATQLIVDNAPTTGVPNTSLAAFNVKAVAVDGISVDGNYTTDITITKASGPGNLTGTTTKTPTNGIVTFDDLQFDAAGTYTLTASSGSLTSATTTDIVVADGTVNTDHFRAKEIIGNWGTAATWESSHDSTAWITATAPPDNNASSIVIGAGHTIDFNVSGSVRKLLVNGGTLNILSSVTLTVTDDGSADKDFVIKGGGIVLNKGTLSIGSGATWQVENGGTFIHNTTSGISTPLNSSTLDVGSNFIYRGSSTLGITPSISGKTYGSLYLESESGVWSPSASGGGAFTVNGSLSIGENVSWNMTNYTGAMTVTDNVSVSGTVTSASFSLATTKELNINPTGVLIVPIGKTVDVSAGTATLKSDATGTGSIGNSVGTLTGNISQERYIPAKAVKKWSFISSPVTQSITNSWQQQIHITGDGIGGTVCPSLSINSNGFDATISNASSVYTYDASQNSGSRWTAVANTTTNVGQGTAFRVNVRGDRSLGCSLLDGSISSSSEVVLKATGAVNNANFNAGSFSIIYPNTPASNYVFVGNPYPSAISFSALRTTNNSAINNTYAIYLPANDAGIYTYWDGVSGKYIGGLDDSNFDNTTGNIIANGQAFFVQATNAGDLTLNFAESHKVNANDAGYFRNARTFNEQIKVSYLQNNTKVDEAVIRYANDATISNTEMSSLDIPSMNSGTFISSVKATKNMVVQTRDLKTLTNDEVWLNIGATQSGTYQLNFSDFENFAGTTIFLKDNYTNTIQDVQQNAVYNFTIDKDNAATKGASRFSIVFNRTVQPVYVSNMIKIYPNPASKHIVLQLPQDNAISYSIRITDIAGKTIMQQKLAAGTQELSIDNLTTGTYIVEVIDNKGNRTTEKLVKQ
ncbi:MAG: T9SS type A sorting domain-containing protein [Chitinophagaceae bacterium]|nr:T9SS type A sorting domain-containing protein [Chitinophagaceae bacterium]MCW5905267.1 T9SS type A sorting domain-containing protein [Chitinophagaceae bacterium]